MHDTNMKYPVKVDITLRERIPVNDIISINTYDAVTTVNGKKLPGPDTIRFDVVIETIPDKIIRTPLYACTLLIQYIHEVLNEEPAVSELDVDGPEYLIQYIDKGLHKIDGVDMVYD